MSPPTTVHSNSYSNRLEPQDDSQDTSQDTSRKRNCNSSRDETIIESFAERLGPEDSYIAQLREQETARIILNAIYPDMLAASQLYNTLSIHYPQLSSNLQFIENYRHIQLLFNQHQQYTSLMNSNPEECSSQIIESRESFILSTMWLSNLNIQTALLISTIVK